MYCNAQLSGFALAIRQIARGEWKLQLANLFCEMCQTGESIFSVKDIEKTAKEAAVETQKMVKDVPLDLPRN